MKPYAAALAAALALAGLAAPADASVTQPSGSLCQADLLEWTETAATFLVSAGPILLTDEDDPSVVHPGTVTCSVSVEPAADHTAPAWFSATGPVSTVAATLSPTVATWTGDPWASHHVCTRVDVAGTTLYWGDSGDRNARGRWSTSPAVECDRSYETADLRPQDFPHGDVLSAALIAAGEAQEAVAAFDTVACTEPAVADEIKDLWYCGAPSAIGSVSFARAPGAAVLRTVPYGWTCTDVHTAATVTRGSLLTVPDPGVSCVPGPGYTVRCDWLEVTAALAPATLGRVHVTEECGALGQTRTFTAGQARLAEVASGRYGRYTLTGLQPPPLRCVTGEDTHPAEPAYTVVCAFWADVSGP